MKNSEGFTAVELIITLIIGSLLLATSYQLYTFVINDSADSRMRATASNLAYRFMRERSIAATTPCTTNEGTMIYTGSIPATANLPSNAVATVTISCLNNSNAISQLTSTITYGNGKSVSHATYVPSN